MWVGGAARTRTDLQKFCILILNSNQSFQISEGFHFTIVWSTLFACSSSGAIVFPPLLLRPKPLEGISYLGNDAQKAN